ncbi:MAG TPA: response regulator [Anaeromyxobacter sp.]|nr:response regulator [Anaeromyxobacter sp.]
MPRPVRILVVDDNHLIRTLLCLILEGAGHLAAGAESGPAALELAPTFRPDLLLVDEVMPEMPGAEVIRCLRRSRDLRLARVPVIGISGHPGASRALLAAGANAFLAKPVQEVPLLDAVDRALVPRIGLDPAARHAS